MATPDHSATDRTGGGDERFVDLEHKLGFLERTVEELNDVIVEQGRAIEGLQASLARLEGRLAGQGDPGQAPFAGGGDDLLAEKPPHY